MIYKPSDIMDIIGGGTPKTSNPDYWEGDIPWLSVKDFNNDLRYVYDTEKKITKLGLDNSNTKFLDRGDIIISARGTVGKIASIPYPMTFNQSCYGLRAKKKIISSDYLYYLIKYNVGKLQKNVHGSVFDTITRDTFSDIEVDIPELEIQNKIVSVLCDIDDKLQLNVTINRNLSEQIQVIFVDLFGEEIRNTKIGEVVPWGDLITVIDHRGKNLPFTTDITDYPIIDVGALRGDIRVIDFRVIDFNNCTKFVNEETYNNWFRSGHPKVWVILLSTVGNLDEMKFFIGKKGCIAQNVVALTYCEKGSVERHNGLIRRFIPKGKRIDQFDVRAIIDVETWINSLLRKLLGYKTADELFEEELDKIYHVDAA